MAHGQHHPTPYEQNWNGFKKTLIYTSGFVVAVLGLMAIFLL